MRFGIFVPNVHAFGDPGVLVDLAQATEAAGWDGFFVWDTMLLDAGAAVPVVDPWVVLGAVAVKTRKVRLGALITPLARRRPWKVARETATLDRLSHGRLVFGAGLGGPRDAEFDAFGEEGDDRARAERLDAGLDLLRELWSGAPTPVPGGATVPGFLPTPVQTPRPPVWIAGFWPRKGPFRRAARWDGVFPQRADGELLTPAEVREIVAYVGEHRTEEAPFDVVLTGETPGDPDAAAETLAPYEPAGVTWWLEQRPFEDPASVQTLLERILAGPPAAS
jgi:alkanesulfonate monooxygenase SsuD/methylene tetrahydromethanopterin reductase-like flavin-dependent oxidoreductase (luciferase family)